jgi:hypothetical protein
LKTSVIIEKLKSEFTRCDAELEYLPAKSRFCGTPSLPNECGVYCLCSLNDSVVQKIGKAEARGGLRARLSGYTAAKTEAKIASDPTLEKDDDRGVTRGAS